MGNLFRGVGQAVGGVATPGDEIEADVALTDAINESTAASQCPVSCFRVLHLNPARLKVLKSPFHNVRSDHVALAPYRINSKRFGDEADRSISVSSALSLNHTDAIKFLSMKVLMQISPAQLVSNFLECKFAKNSVRYTLDHFHLPMSVDRTVVTELITDMINSEAYPGPCLTFAASSFCTKDHVHELKALVDHGAINEVVPSRYQLSPLGFDHVISEGHCHEFRRVLERRADKSIVDLTGWELLDELERDSWAGKPRTGQRLKPLPTSGDLSPDAKVWYFNGSKLDVALPYLACLLSRPSLAAKGDSLHICVAAQNHNF